MSYLHISNNLTGFSEAQHCQKFDLIGDFRTKITFDCVPFERAEDEHGTDRRRF